MKKLFAKKQKLNNEGFTLVEMLVSFVLLAIFLTVATRVIMYTVTLYHHAKGAAYGLEISNTVSSKIAGMLGGAIAESEAEEPVVSSDSNGAVVHFYDATGSEVTISSKDIWGTGRNYINIRYEGVQNEDGTGYVVAPTDWYFAKRTYMDYSVSNFSIEKPGAAYPENVVRLKLTLTSPRYGDYTSEKYIRCINVGAVH